MCDNDPSVMSASLCALFDLISCDLNSYKNLTASLVSILKQVIEHRLPKSFNYHSAPAPFIQVYMVLNILKIYYTYYAESMIIYILSFCSSCTDQTAETSGITWSGGQEAK
jgi:AP-4 complex subunit epsilon-1